MSIPQCLGSCVKEEFNADALDTSLQINPGLALPIGWARYQMDDILNDSTNSDSMHIDENGFISLVYRQDLFSMQASDLIQIPDMSPEIIMPSPFPTPVDLDTITSFMDFPPFVGGIPLTITGSANPEIDSIKFRSGLMRITVSTDYPAMVWSGKIQIGGIPLITLDDDSTSTTVSLADITLPLENNPPSVVNELPITVSLTVFPSRVILNPGPLLNINVELSDLNFKAIYGYMGEFELIPGQQTFPIDFYNSLSGGTFHFSDPRLKLNFDNSFGLPIGIYFQELEVTGDGGTVPITGPGVPDQSNPRTVNYPGFGDEGLSIKDSMVLSNENTMPALSEVMGSSPSEITVGMNAITYPEGPESENFIMDSSRLSVSAELRLPMEGFTDTLDISDTLDFVFGEFYENPPEEIQRLIFRVKFQNQFPVDIYTQIYFYDEGGQLLDSLFHDVADPLRLVKGADNFNGEGVAEVNIADPVDVELTREQIDNISTSAYIIVTGKVSTSGNPPNQDVRFYSFYYFQADIGVIAELKMNSDDY